MSGVSSMYKTASHPLSDNDLGALRTSPEPSDSVTMTTDKLYLHWINLTIFIAKHLILPETNQSLFQYIHLKH